MPKSFATRSCSYCGLPAPADSAADDANGEGVFCCLGCRIASGILCDDDQAHSRWAATRLGLAIFFTMNVMVFTLVLWTWNVHQMPETANVAAFREILRYACLLFSAPVLVLLGGPLLESCVDSLRSRQFTVDALLLIGVVAAFGYSTASLLLDLPDVYFEVCCMILVAVTFGKWLEATAKQKATRAIRSLRQLLPATARLQAPRGEISVPLAEIQSGDRLRILPGERIPVDGFVENQTAVDQQVITGESIPIEVECGQTVYGGSLNLSRELFLKAVSTAESGAIARLASAVEAATAAKNCQTIRLADRLAAGFLPLIGIASLIAFGLHAPSGLQHATMSALSVVLIACPCAIGIATPLALWVAINSAACHGIIFRNGDAVIRLSKIRSLGFDKTGTLTKGDMQINHVAYAETAERKLVRQVALRLTTSSNHVVSTAISAFCADDGELGDLQLYDLQDHPGKGITGRFDQSNSRFQTVSTAFLGSPTLARELGGQLTDEISEVLRVHSAHACVCVGWDDKVQAVFCLADTLREESTSVLAELRDLKIQTIVLTGDSSERAAAIAKLTGVPSLGELLPEEKSKQLQKLLQPAAMVGDGMNDALALAETDVGIAMDCGADVSRNAADICLLGSTLGKLPTAIKLARATQRTIRRNLIWAVSYNVIGMGFAITGNLNPIVAAIAMVGSSLFVLTNSLSLAMNNKTPVFQDTPASESIDAQTRIERLPAESQPGVEVAL